MFLINKYILAPTTLSTKSYINGGVQAKKEKENCWEQGLLLVQQEVLVCGKSAFHQIAVFSKLH